MSGRGRYDLTRNVTWLAFEAGQRESRRDAALTALHQSVSLLVGQIQRSERLRADIAAGIEIRRYELYRRSVSAGAGASHRSLAAAQRVHLGCLLQFVHAIAAAAPEDHARDSDPAAPREPLVTSIRELEASVSRTRRLSRDMLTECQRPDWREGASARDESRPGPDRA